MSKKTVEGLFTELGIKITKQRKSVFNFLDKTQGFLSAEQIYSGLKERDERINLSTVYRILELFVTKGIVIKSGIPNENKFVYEMNRTEHQHHLICIGCNRMVPVQGCPLEILQNSLMKNTDFDITGHKFEIFGYCPKCKKH